MQKIALVKSGQKVSIFWATSSFQKCAITFTKVAQ
jgi:hypothetical protein